MKNRFAIFTLLISGSLHLIASPDLLPGGYTAILSNMTLFLKHLTIDTYKEEESKIIPIRNKANYPNVTKLLEACEHHQRLPDIAKEFSSEVDDKLFDRQQWIMSTLSTSAKVKECLERTDDFVSRINDTDFSCGEPGPATVNGGAAEPQSATAASDTVAAEVKPFMEGPFSLFQTDIDVHNRRDALSIANTLIKQNHEILERNRTSRATILKTIEETLQKPGS